MSRKRATARRSALCRRLGAMVVLVLLAAAGWAWWQARAWAPPRDAFPVQGVLVDAGDGPVDFTALAAIGASFVYLAASEGGEGRDEAFARNLARAGASGVRTGAVHDFDPCVPAEIQAANFLTVVPRDVDMLPPAVALARTAEGCADKLSEARLESELTTFLNQIEGHAGWPAILAIAPRFEQRYQVASRFERELWLKRTWRQPDYAGRPWSLWTANSARRTEAGPGPLRWVVAQP